MLILYNFCRLVHIRALDPVYRLVSYHVWDLIT